MPRSPGEGHPERFRGAVKGPGCSEASLDQAGMSERAGGLPQRYALVRLWGCALGQAEVREHRVPALGEALDVGLELAG
jgi:hypothetical protein